MFAADGHIEITHKEKTVVTKSDVDVKHNVSKGNFIYCDLFKGYNEMYMISVILLVILLTRKM